MWFFIGWYTAICKLWPIKIQIELSTILALTCCLFIIIFHCLRHVQAQTGSNTIVSGLIYNTWAHIIISYKLKQINWLFNMPLHPHTKENIVAENDAFTLTKKNVSLFVINLISWFYFSSLSSSSSLTF